MSENVGAQLGGAIADFLDWWGDVEAYAKRKGMSTAEATAGSGALHAAARAELAMQGEGRVVEAVPHHGDVDRQGRLWFDQLHDLDGRNVGLLVGRSYLLTLLPEKKKAKVLAIPWKPGKRLSNPGTTYYCDPERGGAGVACQPGATSTSPPAPTAMRN